MKLYVAASAITSLFLAAAIFIVLAISDLKHSAAYGREPSGLSFAWFWILLLSLFAAFLGLRYWFGGQNDGRLKVIDCFVFALTSLVVAFVASIWIYVRPLLGPHTAIGVGVYVAIIKGTALSPLFWGISLLIFAVLYGIRFRTVR